jgi:uncharacterized Zn finger protein (UPF0148 family)
MQHAENMGAHMNRREKMGSLNAELVDLQNKLADVSILKSIEMRDRVAEIKSVLKTMGSEADGVDYFTDTAAVLFRYYGLIDGESSASKCLDVVPTKTLQDKQEKQKSNSILKYFGIPEVESDFKKNKNEGEDCKQQRGSLLDSYMEMVNKSHVKQELLEDRRALCSHCGSEDRTLMNNDGFVICNGCHTVEYTIVDHEKPSYKEPPKEITYFSYRRSAHAREWLNQVQGKETTDIPEEVFDSILHEIKKQRIDNIANLTHAKVKSILKKIKIGKYYEHTAYIINRLNGNSAPSMPLELEEKLLNMFLAVQVPFARHSPLSRKNFISYSYTIRKCIELLSEDQYIKYFPYLRSRDKLANNDVIWRKICKDLNWEFIRSL